jgi:acetolactate synthase regulatory subunit
MKELYILTIKADPRPGLLHLITGILEKKLIRIVCFSLEAPAADGTVLVTATVMIDPAGLKSLALRLENIIEVFSVTMSGNVTGATAEADAHLKRILNAEMQLSVI